MCTERIVISRIVQFVELGGVALPEKLQRLGEHLARDGEAKLGSAASWRDGSAAVAGQGFGQVLGCGARAGWGPPVAMLRSHDATRRALF